MVDLKVIQKRGGTQENLKKVFESPEKSEELKAWINRTSSRIHDGIQRTQINAQNYWAIDRAYDVTQRQITFTLVEGFLSRSPSTEQVLQAAKDWSLDAMMVDVYEGGKRCMDPSGKNPIKRFDLPTFFQIFVPIVAAYVKMRWAKLFNDRDLYPLYKYEPLKLTMLNRTKSEIITDRIQRMSTEMGYREDERQSILQTLLYGSCINFPQEEWHKETQIVMGDSGEEEEQVVKEGVRFSIPHPTRVFYDLAHRPSTMNTDTGCAFAGFWDLVRYGDIKHDQAYWNRDVISFGPSKHKWTNGDQWKLYTTLYPCVAKWPGVQPKTQDRTEAAFQYATNDPDTSVCIVNYFEKLIPKDHGMFDYDKPIWMRFVIAGDDTVIYAAPLPYCPPVAYLYDADQNRQFNTSLALELLPWQDHLGNYLTQYLLSVKQNLDTAVFWNADLLDQKDIDSIQNLGEKRYKSRKWIPISQRQIKFSQASERDAFWPVNFPKLETSEISSAIRIMIDVMERMLGFSSQELGSPASHEQSATEVSIVNLNTSVRLEFTGGLIDSGMRARKRLLYEAMMAYSSDEILAEIADLNDQKKEALEKMGFKIEDQEGDGAKAGVVGDKRALRLDGFASERDGVNRIADSKLAGTMIQTFQTMFSNPAIVQTTGIQQLVEMFNQILVYAGLPRDFRLKMDPNQQQQQQAAAERQAGQQEQVLAALQQQLAQFSQQLIQSEMQKVGDAVVQMIQPVQQGVAANNAQLQEFIQQQMTQNAVTEDMMEKLAAITAAGITAPPAVQPPPSVYDQVPPIATPIG